MEKYTVHLAGNTEDCQDVSSPQKWYVDPKQLQSKNFLIEIYKIHMEKKVQDILKICKGTKL